MLTFCAFLAYLAVGVAVTGASLRLGGELWHMDPTPEQLAGSVLFWPLVAVYSFGPYLFRAVAWLVWVFAGARARRRHHDPDYREAEHEIEELERPALTP